MSGIISIILERIRQKRRTIAYPKSVPELPARYLGRPELNLKACDNCGACAEVCPVAAISFPLALDLGLCVFCGECAKACPKAALSFSRDHRMAVSKREDLILSGQELVLAKPLEPARLKLFARSLKLRQVSAGGCNACEADLNVLGTVVFDLPRFGLDFVASPRHADGLALTGPVPENMREAYLSTYAATPDPKVLMAVGVCAISGGIFAGLPETRTASPEMPRPDLFIPGCPPHPLTILDGMLRLLGRL